MTLDERATGEQVERVEVLLDQIEMLHDPDARSIAVEAIGALLELYGEGLSRMMASIAGRGGDEIFHDFAADDLVSHLLLLHGLHPISVETRVIGALDEVRPYLQSHGGDVELVGVVDGVAHLRMQGSCDGCPASSMTLKLAIEDAIQKVAPDLEGIEAEGTTPSMEPPVFMTTPGSQPGEHSSWVVAGGLPQLANGGLLVREIAGDPVLFLKLDADFYAYETRCPNCGTAMEDGTLHGAELACGECAYRYDVRRAGRCMDAPQIHLRPVPLLVSETGIVKVALADAPAVAAG